MTRAAICGERARLRDAGAIEKHPGICNLDRFTPR
jgi:hypothetical protein